MPEINGVDSPSDAQSSAQMHSSELTSVMSGHTAAAGAGADPSLDAAAGAARDVASETNPTKEPDAAQMSHSDVVVAGAGEPTRLDGALAGTAGEATGEPRVDAALAQINDIDTDAPSEAVVQLTQAYERLQRVLSEP